MIASRLARFFDSDSIQQRLGFLEAKEASLARPRARAERKPWFCSGCPHNTSTVVPEGSRAYGGIGCHYMATWMDRGTVTFTQMGGEGATWLGQAPFTETRHVFQNLGDGTYFHSGLLAIRAAVAAGVNITYKILYNDAVAMTGGQSFDGPLSVGQVVEQLRAEGVKRVAVISDEPDSYRGEAFARAAGVSVSHRDQLQAIQTELRDTPGCTALIYAQTCAAEKRRRRKKGILADPPKRAFINAAVCEGCGDCGVQSNCLSIIPEETALGRKRAIDQSACNKDFSCLRGFCPSFVTVQGGSLRKSPGVTDAAALNELPQPVPRKIDDNYSILITGIGGTGILTVGAVLGMAAHIEGKGASVLNQTGLAQKFGAVSGHVRIAEKQADIYSPRIQSGDANLLLGADLVVSASNDALAKLSRDASHAVINSHLSPTAEFTRDADVVFPLDDMEQAILDEIEPEHGHFVNATRLATGLLGDAIFANFLLLGAAYQHGLVPLAADSILEAIALNGVAVEKNREAFAWGRRYAEDADAVRRAAGFERPHQKPAAVTDLDKIVDFRRAFLIEYQDKAYADRYLRLLARVQRAEQKLYPHRGNNELVLTAAAARSYFQLLAYKDEYEVARLYSNGEFERRVADKFEGDYRLRFHLAPPWFARRDAQTGIPRKREFGAWIMPLFRLLARGKGLRGGAFDVFGYSAERRMERELIEQFEDDIDSILAMLTDENFEVALELAALPQKIRGFGHVKQKSAADASNRRKALLRQFDQVRDRAVEVYSP